MSARRAVVQDLVCSDCGKGGFADVRAVESHRVAHKTTSCGACGKTGINVKGLGGHRRICEPYQRQKRPTSGGGAGAELAHLEGILGRLTRPKALKSVRELLQRAEAFPSGGFLVIGDHWGPYITRRERVGDVVAGSRDACIVLDLARVVEALQLEAVREKAEALGWGRL